MILYHGSYEIVKRPLVSKGRANLDFGQGFYMTKLKEQAENWAEIIASRRGPNAKAFVNEYELNDACIKEANVLSFAEYDLEWLDFIVSSRKGLCPWLGKDIVEGGVANDRVIDTVEDYAAGIITAEQALGQLKYKKINHQLCILNQEILDKNLKFIRYEIVKDV